MEWIIALISSTVGVIAGFSLTFLTDLKKRSEVKYGLGVALFEEIKQTLQHVCVDYDSQIKFFNYFKEAAKNSFKKAKPTMISMRHETSLVYKNNLDKIELFNPEIIEKLVSFYNYLGVVRAHSAMVEKSFQDFYGDKTIITSDGLSKTLNSHKSKTSRIIRIGNEIADLLHKELKIEGEDFQKILPTNQLEGG